MLKIAIVEYQPEAAQRLESFLRRYSAENSEAFDATVFNDAVAFLSNFKQVYDLVFMDIELPGMNFEDGGTTIERNGQIGGHKA